MQVIEFGLIIHCRLVFMVIEEKQMSHINILDSEFGLIILKSFYQVANLPARQFGPALQISKFYHYLFP